MLKKTHLLLSVLEGWGRQTPGQFQWTASLVHTPSTSNTVTILLYSLTLTGIRQASVLADLPCVFIIAKILVKKNTTTLLALEANMPKMESLHQTNKNTDVKVVVHNTASLYRYWVWLQYCHRLALSASWTDTLQIMKPHGFTGLLFQAQVSCSAAHIKPRSSFLPSTRNCWVSFQRAINSNSNRKSQEFKLERPLVT